MRLRDELEEGCTGVSVGAAAHGWRALTFPLAPFLSHTGSGRGGRLVRLTGRAILGSLPLPVWERKGGLARTHGGPRTQWSDMHSTGLMQHPSF